MNDLETAAMAPTPLTPPAAPAAKFAFLDRDHSILAFNERVLDWARRAEVPVLERLRFLCIVSSNLDEFFEVRAAPHLLGASSDHSNRPESAASLAALSAAAKKLVASQYTLYNDSITPALAEQGIRILSHGERTTAQRKWVHEYFEREVRPLLVPVALDPAHPFPQVANKSLNFIVRLSGKVFRNLWLLLNKVWITFQKCGRHFLVFFNFQRAG